MQADFKRISNKCGWTLDNSQSPSDGVKDQLASSKDELQSLHTEWISSKRGADDEAV
jgi:hypothetical protein